MKLAKRLFITRKSSIPELKFQKQELSSFSGLVVFQKLFSDLNLSKRLSGCLPRSCETKQHVSVSLLFRLLIINALIGMRSYYPLFCTIAQSGQILDLLHRSGNVHDSRGSIEFVKQCVQKVRNALPGVRLEIRMDSAFFSDAMVRCLKELKVLFAISVPFERFCELKGFIEKRRRWSSMGSAQNSSAFAKKMETQVVDQPGTLSVRTNGKSQANQGSSPTGPVRTPRLWIRL